MRLILACLLLCACATPRYAVPEVDAAAAECAAQGGTWGCSTYEVRWDSGARRTAVLCACDEE